MSPKEPYTIQAFTTRWLPTDPPRPCPPLLTEEEAALYFRLESKDIKQAMMRLRKAGLRAVQIGVFLRYRPEDLDEFIDERAESDPR